MTRGARGCLKFIIGTVVLVLAVVLILGWKPFGITALARTYHYCLTHYGDPPEGPREGSSIVEVTTDLDAGTPRRLADYSVISAAFGAGSVALKPIDRENCGLPVDLWTREESRFARTRGDQTFAECDHQNGLDILDTSQKAAPLLLTLDDSRIFHSQEPESDTVQIFEVGEDRHSPPMITRIPEKFRFRSSVGATRAYGINIITSYPDFESIADLTNRAYGVDCVGYCNGQMMISIDNVPVEWSSSRWSRQASACDELISPK
jgi:hypothetical protein